MPALDQYMRDHASLIAENMATDAAEAERIERALAAEAYDKLDRLCRDSLFQWFMDSFVAPIAKAAHDNALDTKKHPDERNNHCQQYNVAKGILGLAENKMAFYKQQAGFAD